MTNSKKYEAKKYFWRRKEMSAADSKKLRFSTSPILNIRIGPWVSRINWYKGHWCAQPVCPQAVQRKNRRKTWKMHFWCWYSSSYFFRVWTYLTTLPLFFCCCSTRNFCHFNFHFSCRKLSDSLKASTICYWIAILKVS